MSTEGQEGSEMKASSVSAMVMRGGWIINESGRMGGKRRM